MMSGQIGNGSVSPFTNTRIENTIRPMHRIVTSFYLNSWPPAALMNTTAAVVRMSPSGFIR